MDKKQILEKIQAMEAELTEHRRWLHTHAEVGFSLEDTKNYVCNCLKDMGYAPVPCGKAGVVVTAGGHKPGKVFLLRADMDALPIKEEADVSFACGTGSMHACGHDMHTAMLLGAAKILKECEADIPGTVKLMFQPAEEIFEGASDMIHAGVLKNPAVDAALMIHVTAGTPLPTGTVIVSAPGVSAPAADYFTITVQGKGCHGSAPHNGVDALTAAAHTVIALQEIQARELPASDESVLTIGTIRGGSADNAIADTVVMGGTMRTYDEKTRLFLKERLVQISLGVASLFRADAKVSFGSGCPVLVNDRDLADHTQRCLTDLFGPGKVFSTASFSADGKPSRGGGSEDFAYISQQVPSLMLALAAGSSSEGYIYPQHHPKVRFDEKALRVGTASLVYSALSWLDTHK